MVGEQISEKAGVWGPKEQEREEEETGPHRMGHKCRPMGAATIPHRTGREGLWSQAGPPLEAVVPPGSGALALTCVFFSSQEMCPGTWRARPCA